MKNLRLIPAFLMVLFLSATAFANSGGEGAVKPEAAFAYSVHAIKGSEKFSLAFKNRTDATVKIEIYGEEGKRLFKDVQSNKEMHKLYNLSEIGAGKYRIVITSGDFKAEETIAVGMNVVSKRDFEAVISPDAQLKDKMRLGFSNAEDIVSITITNKAGKVVYTDRVSGVSNYNQRFDMSTLAPGIYQIAIASNGKTIEQSYAVE